MNPTVHLERLVVRVPLVGHDDDEEMDVEEGDQPMVEELQVEGESDGDYEDDDEEDEDKEDDEDDEGDGDDNEEQIIEGAVQNDVVQNGRIQQDEGSLCSNSTPITTTFFR